MPTTTEALNKAKHALFGLTVNQLAGRAGCAAPPAADTDSPVRDHAGAQFLSGVRDAVWDLLSDLDTDDLMRLAADPSDVGWVDDDGRVHEIADGAPSVYTYRRWAQFVDLAAFTEDTTDLAGENADVTSLAGIALYQIAERLAYALLTEAAEALAGELDDDEDGRFLVYRVDEDGRPVENRFFETRTAAYDFYAQCDKNDWMGVFLRPAAD